MTQRAPILVRKPTNKFIPPHFDASQSLVRTHLFAAGLPRNTSKLKAIVMEAQAGQGKSTLASQFLEVNALKYIWYQMGPEDSDPYCALSSILLNLESNFPAFHSFQFNSILGKEKESPLDLRKWANIILSDLTTSHPDDLYIVFDDLHRIQNGSLTNTLIDHLIDDSPPNLHFVLLSRHPLELRAKALRNSQSICYLTTKDLALTPQEIESLFCNLLKQPISRQDALDIHDSTNGWIMGIFLARHPSSGRVHSWRKNIDSAKFPSSGRNYLLEYIEDEIFTHIPEKLHIPLEKLALFDEIPVGLAQIITGIEEIGLILSWLSSGNYFVYQLDEHQNCFCLHNNLREFLHVRARRQLSERVTSDIYTRGAEYYLDLGMHDKAMFYYLKTFNYKKMEEIIKTQGLALIALHKTNTILATLKTIPDDALFQSGWLTLYIGILQMDYTPQDTLRYFDSARARFSESGDETGELIALSQLIYYHSVISGCYNLGTELLARTEKLLLKNEAVLSVHVRVVAAGNLALGLCLFKSEMENARSFGSMACNLAGKHALHNFAASSRFILGYIELLSGNISKFRKEAEACFPLLNSPEVGWSNKLTIRMIYLCHLSMTGEYLNFSAQKQEIHTTIGHNFLAETIAAPSLHLWEASNLFASGKSVQAMELLHRGVGSTLSATTDHMHSQLLQWQAFGHALLSENQEALTCINHSIRLRSKTGGPFHQALNAIIAGAVYSRLNMSDFAEYFFAKGLTISSTIPAPFLQISAHLNQSFHRLVTDGPAAALTDLRSGLSLMKKHCFNHFWTWEPAMMIRLLSLAVQNKIESSYAQQIAREKLDVAFTDTGDLIPLLNFTLLDNFQICSGQQLLFKTSSFTPSQRELLAFLLTAREQRISQERLQLELWPDKPPENARRSFDTLLTRLRKEFSSKLPVHIINYISMQKGILVLSHSRIDAVEFSRMASAGVQHSRSGEWWQAGNSFRTAISHWKGLWPEESFCNEETSVLSDQLINCLLDITLIWAQNLVEMNRCTEAIGLLEHTLQAHFQDERLIRLLYSLYIQGHNILKASDTLDRYRTALGKLDYSAEEIEALLAADPTFSAKRTK